ncbi:MAG: ATP-dependent DNA helicase RecQ [Cyanobacteria bacterium SZAS LIN-5]|nr:ATP-dependent DNA helicase RecQ [Cyanobacteria bacterium SZAS LIN-5]RTL42654.1 MAG: ATP-dependent DNA helicase RecQ [Candidatus Melainabacteria bacterium]
MAVSDFLLDSVLHERFGLKEFRPKQREVIDHVMNGRHTLALLPTGYGKSLCYQVPSQILPGATIVVSPLIALMQDQLNGLMRRGITNATLLNSSVSPDELDIRFGGIKAGVFKLVFVAPERFESPRFRNLLEQIDVSLLVIDEAHCISQWGHDFRPQYRNLSSYILSHLKAASVLALTATATPQVQRDIIQSLNLSNMNVVTGSFDRPNIRFEVEPVTNAVSKDNFVFSALKSTNAPAIVYTSSRKEAEALSERMRQSGLTAACYHAGLSSEQRQRAQKLFEGDKVSTIVSTVAFGMGVDKANIRRVIHYNLPGSLESYYQEAGRAGRDGESATCTLLYQSKDVHTQRWLMDRNFPTAHQVEIAYKLIVSSGLQPMRISTLLDDMDIADSALNSALDLLKQLQLIDTTPDGSFLARVSDGTIEMNSLNQRKLRHSQRLDQMIRYAQDAICRRRQILGYFGQVTEACSGCDVCDPQERTHLEKHRQTGQSVLEDGKTSNLAEAILQIVTDLNGTVGRTTIAQILSGSGNKKLKEKGLDRVPLFGRFSVFKQDQLLASIDELIGKGDLQSIPGMYPKVVITANGAQKLGNAKAVISSSVVDLR